MEKTLDKGEDKIQKICDALRFETLEPAQVEAKKILEDAKSRAEQVIAEAREETKKILDHARKVVEKERNVFHSSLEQASKQSLEELRQAIEENLFRKELQELVDKPTQDPKVIADLITAIIEGIEKEGIKTDLAAIVTQTIKPEQVNALLLEGIVKKLKGGGVTLGEFSGGAQVKLLDKKMTIDITDQYLQDLLSRYIRKDFRKLIFGN